MAEPKRRGRPPGVKNKQTAAPAKAAPPAGANNDDRQKVIFLQMVQKAQRAAAEVKAARSAFNQVLKEADELGVSKSDIKWALKQKTADPEKELQKARRQLEMARWLGLPLGTQLGLFDAPMKPSELERAYDEGKTAGMLGKTAISPYHAGQEQTQKWMEGWHDGQAALRDAFMKNNSAPLVEAAEANPPATSGDDAFNDAIADAVADAPVEDIRDMKLDTVGEGPADLAPAPNPSWPDGGSDDEDVRPSFLKSQDEGAEDL